MDATSRGYNPKYRRAFGSSRRHHYWGYGEARAKKLRHEWEQVVPIPVYKYTTYTLHGLYWEPQWLPVGDVRMGVHMGSLVRSKRRTGRDWKLYHWDGHTYSYSRWLSASQLKALVVTLSLTN